MVYSAIYEFSHSADGPAAYSLDQAGNEKYEDFIDGISKSLNSQWARNMSPEEKDDKDARHVLRLAVEFVVTTLEIESVKRKLFHYFHALRISQVISRLSNLPVLKMRST